MSAAKESSMLSPAESGVATFFDDSDNDKTSENNTMQELEELVSRIQDRDIKEKQLVKSLDNHLLPLFCIFYFADYLDRANIGNAALMGIQDDLKMTDGQLSFAISAFYITYIIFHVPSNVIMKRTNASIWLSSIMFAWGTITIVTAFVRNFAGLLSCRLILGVAESGYIPGILYQLSSVYKPRELGIRIAVMLCMSQLSGIVSGPIAYGTSFLEGRMHMHGWQYLFILEGVPTVVLSIASYCLLFDDVNTVSWLTDEQKALQQYRMTENRPLRSKHTHVTLSTFKEALVDWKLWLFAITYLCNATNMTSASIFAPRIIDGFGFTVLQSQLLTAPPSLVSSALVILSGYFVDKYYRFPFMLVGFALLAIGYGLLLVLDTPWSLYGAVFVINAGIGLQMPANVGWSTVNFPDMTVRAVAVAMVVMIGNSGGVIGSFLYPQGDAPRYIFGNVFNAVCAIFGGIVSLATAFLLWRENTQRDQLGQPKPGSEDNSIEEQQEHLQYRFYY